jgi:hypothetical protein
MSFVSLSQALLPEHPLQCSMPCFKGLFPAPFDDEVQDLLFVLCYFHASIRSRIHTETTVSNLEGDATSVIGVELRRFTTSICAQYKDKTIETEAESAARVRRATAAAKKTGGSVPEGIGRRREKVFNLRTVKVHRLGHFGPAIRRIGPMDNVDSRHVCFSFLYLTLKYSHLSL